MKLRLIVNCKFDHVFSVFSTQRCAAMQANIVANATKSERQGGYT